jgi:hypothetical protein
LREHDGTSDMRPKKKGKLRMTQFKFLVFIHVLSSLLDRNLKIDKIPRGL